MPPFFVHFWRPKAPSNDGCDVFFFYCVLLLQVAQMAPKPPEWLVQLTSALGNWFSYSCFGSSLTASHKGARDVYHRLGLYPETAQPGSRKRFTGGALLSSSWVALLTKPFLQRERPHCDCLPGSRLPFPVVVYAALRAWHFTTTRRSDTRQSHRCHTCTSYACRHSPTAQT